MSNIKEKALFGRLEDKDKEAFIQAYDLYLEPIYRFVYFKVGDQAEAEDLTSATFLKAWNYIQENSIKDYGTLRALLYKITRNLIIDHYRKKNIQSSVSVDDPDSGVDLADESADLEKNVEIAFDFEKLEEKMFELKDEYREILLMKYIEELSINEIAQILDKTPGNVRVLTYRAIKALQDLVKK